jgi:hypothetical protein
MLWAGNIEKRHLWCVLTDPDPVTKKLVVVMLVSAKAHTERHVAINVGEHSFISRPTHVDYGIATFVPLSALVDAIGSGAAIAMEDLSRDLLLKLRIGLYGSSRVAYFLTDYCKKIFGPDGLDIPPPSQEVASP